MTDPARLTDEELGALTPEKWLAHRKAIAIAVYGSSVMFTRHEVESLLAEYNAALLAEVREHRARDLRYPENYHEDKP